MSKPWPSRRRIIYGTTKVVRVPSAPHGARAGASSGDWVAMLPVRRTGYTLSEVELHSSARPLAVPMD